MCGPPNRKYRFGSAESNVDCPVMKQSVTNPVELCAVRESLASERTSRMTSIFNFAHEATDLEVANFISVTSISYVN